MSEKIKIYKSDNGENYFILWNNRLVEVVEQVTKKDYYHVTTFPIHYSIRSDTSEFDYLTEAERDAAYDELTALLEQARKQLAERDAKKAEIEAARELLKDGKRAKIYKALINDHAIIFGGQYMALDINAEVSDVRKGSWGGYYFTHQSTVFTFHSEKKAERMRNKLIDYLARAKAQLLLEEEGE